jgi:catechol 2,3-dioxygenase-like lactoylglutathione lyase family enzyme
VVAFEDVPGPIVPSLLPRDVHHVGYVVADLAAAARTWRDIAGVGPFVTFEHLPFEEVTVDGSAAAVDHSAAFAAHGTMFVELQVYHSVEPASAVRRLQPSRPPGLNHVAYAVDDVATESRRLRGLGLPLTVEARTADLRVCWHDASATLGFAVELHENNAAFASFFAAVSAEAATWGGRELLRVVPG